MGSCENPDESLPAERLRNKTEPDPTDRGEGPLGNRFKGRMFFEGPDKANLVKNLQKMLLKWKESTPDIDFDLGDTGENHDGIDGDFGPLTETAVITFQENMTDFEGQSLEKDGLVGPRTADALNRAMVGSLFDCYQTPIELTRDLLLISVTAERLQQGITFDGDSFVGQKQIKVEVHNLAELRKECFVFAQLFDAQFDSPLSNTAYTLTGILSGESVSGVADDEGIVRHELLIDDHYEIAIGNAKELVPVFYMAEKEEISQPNATRIRGLISSVS